MQKKLNNDESYLSTETNSNAEATFSRQKYFELTLATLTIFDI